MNLPRDIHMLEVAALLVPFVALSLLVVYLSFVLAWRKKL